MGIHSHVFIKLKNGGFRLPQSLTASHSLFLRLSTKGEYWSNFIESTAVLHYDTVVLLWWYWQDMLRSERPLTDNKVKENH